MHRNSKSGIYSNKSIRYNNITNTKTTNGSLFVINNRAVIIGKKYYKDFNNTKNVTIIDNDN